MQDKILDFLKRKPEYISGDQISHRLGITRQALWKHIQALKDSGYDIVAVPHLGYKLVSAPDRLLPEEVSWNLNTGFIGREIRYFESIPSTMDLATDLGSRGFPEGTLVLAETQTKGRGRLARAWISPKHKGIYLSLILRPKIPPALSPLLTLLAAVSICEAISVIAGLEARIKWPNDIFIHQKKVGGILTEMSAETDEVRFVVVGIGLNVNNDKKALPEGATSLKEQKKEGISRIELLREILRRTEDNYLKFQKTGGEFIIDRWRQYSLTLGKRIKVSCNNERVEGQALDIDKDGGLLIRNDAGLVQKVMSGDVVHCRQ